MDERVLAARDADDRVRFGEHARPLEQIEAVDVGLLRRLRAHHAEPVAPLGDGERVVARAGAPQPLRASRRRLDEGDVAVEVAGRSVVWNGPSFGDRVRERIDGRPVEHPRMVPSLQTYSKGSERVEVHYGAFPDDQRALMIDYKADGPSPSAQDIRTGLEKRYGKGASPFGTFEKWCWPASCGGSAATLSANGQTIDLFAGGGLGALGADDRRVDAAAHASGRGPRGSF